MDLQKVATRVAQTRVAANQVIVVFRNQAGDFAVTTTNAVTPSGPRADVHLPGGEVVSFYVSLDVLKQTEDMENKGLLEALFNRGLIETDDDGNFLV